jgi:hypothetical protein
MQLPASIKSVALHRYALESFVPRVIPVLEWPSVVCVKFCENGSSFFPRYSAYDVGWNAPIRMSAMASLAEICSENRKI